MDLEQRVQTLFADSIATHREAARQLPMPIAQAAGRLISALRRGNKLLVCGNGGSAADAQHFAAELVNRFEVERPGLPAIALTTDSSSLTAIANDYNFSEIFARQLRALGTPGDVLLAISTSGRSPNIVAAIRAAREAAMITVLLTGENGGDCLSAIGENDIVIRVPARSTARIQEVHVLVLHCLCDLVDQCYTNRLTEEFP